MDRQALRRGARLGSARRASRAVSAYAVRVAKGATVIRRGALLLAVVTIALLTRRRKDVRESAAPLAPSDLAHGSQLVDSRDDRAISILTSEYTFVSGLIPFYRRVEIAALGGTGATIAALLAFIGALEATQDPDRALEAALLSLASLVPTLLLLLELMALTRVMRASAYIRTHIYPVARELSARDDLLLWEFSPTKDLLDELATAEQPGPPSRFVKVFASSAPVIAAILTAAVGLPLAGYLLAPDEALEPAQLVGYVSAAAALALGGRAIWSTLRFEARSPKGNE